MAGKRKSRVTIEQMKNALIRTRGRVFVAASQLGMSPAHMYRQLNKYPELQEVKDAQHGEMLDFVEMKLFKQINEDNLGAIIFYLKTQGQHRGWSEKVHFVHEIPQIQELMILFKEHNLSAGEVFGEMIRELKNANTAIPGTANILPDRRGDEEE